MKTILVYPCGTRAKVKDIDISGDVTRVSLIGSLIIMYEISYYFNNQYHSHWFYEFQLIFNENDKKIQIGFKEVKNNE